MMHIFQTYLWILIPLSISTIHGQASISGSLLIDGFYKASIDMQLVEPSLYQGEITYEDIDTAYTIVANAYRDTLHIQELDQLLNPTAQIMLVQQLDGTYSGLWYDEVHRMQLPTAFYVDEREVKEHMSYRYSFNPDLQDYQVLHTVPLSPEVHLAQLAHMHDDEIVSAAKVVRQDSILWFTEAGSLLPMQTDIAEVLPVIPYRYIGSEYSFEAYLPAYGEVWLDSMSEFTQQWQARLEQVDHPVVDSRFPVRYYLICDVDYWTADYLAGSVDCVGPQGVLDGMTYIYQRRQSRFIAPDELFKGGRIELDNQKADMLPGWSMNYYGLLQKGAFNPLAARVTHEQAWASINSKLKKQVQALYR